VTNSERRIQRVRKALEPPAGAVTTSRSSASWPAGWAAPWGTRRRRNSGRVPLPLPHARRNQLPPPGGLGASSALPRRGNTPEACSCTAGSGAAGPGDAGPLSARWRTNAGRRAQRGFSDPAHHPDAVWTPNNTGVQSGGYSSPCASRSTCTRPRGRAAAPVVETKLVLASSRRARRGPVHLDPGLRPGLAFMTLHFPDQVATNLLTSTPSIPIGHRRVQGRAPSGSRSCREGGGRRRLVTSGRAAALPQRRRSRLSTPSWDLRLPAGSRAAALPGDPGGPRRPPGAVPP